MIRKSFREIIGSIKYTGADSEGFHEPIDYKLVIDRISKLVSDYFKLTYVNGKENDKNFSIQISIDDKDHELIVDGNGWFDRELIELLNRIISELNQGMKIYFIEPYGSENSDQGFSIAYLSEECSREFDEFGYLSNSNWQKWSDHRITDFHDNYADLVVL